MKISLIYQHNCIFVVSKKNDKIERGGIILLSLDEKSIEEKKDKKDNRKRVNFEFLLTKNI